MKFEDCLRLPVPGDNVAIATRRLAAGVGIRSDGQPFRLTHTVLEGHRVAVRPIARGEELLSWGLPFGAATRDIGTGEYVCNAKILRALAGRDVDFELPSEANFEDRVRTCTLDRTSFRAGIQVAPADMPAMMEGFVRPGPRGTGTRNYVLVLALTSNETAFANALAARFRDVPSRYPGIDGVVPACHTEGGGDRSPNNLEFVLRTLAGFIVHPNVGAALIVDGGRGAYDAAMLRQFMEANGYPLDKVTHGFFEIRRDFDSELSRAGALAESWLPEVAAVGRETCPASGIRVALQCGGSDAFSGVSGNALAGWVAKQVIRHGGAANLAETDELIGAEPYILSNVRDIDTAQRFLDKISIFKERAAIHGASAEGNPSGGNNYRGLYNIALKSIGAARKKDPDVRLDYVIDYAAPMRAPGYYFMDSPGNDLESIAGQVASGANMIFFITGNGSITNFPFVPTLKFVTTSGRFNLLHNEMDINAGRYNDGESMDSLGEETFRLALAVASGRRSKGELAGHSQVQIWRDWPLTQRGQLEVVRAQPVPDGRPLAIVGDAPLTGDIPGFRTEIGVAFERVGLIMPTSLCSGQVARLIAEDLNADPPAADISRHVSLPHTEGCASANVDDLYLRVLLGYVTHPSVCRALLLEHGCERTHNDAVRHYLMEHDLNPARFGWASVQLDGGIDAVRAKARNWFQQSASAIDRSVDTEIGRLRLGISTEGNLNDGAAIALATLIRRLAAAGGTVVITENAGAWESDVFRRKLLADANACRATLSYGEHPKATGVHVMATPTGDRSEILTGLGGCGVDVILVLVNAAPWPSHPLVPVLQCAEERSTAQKFGGDIDAILDPADAVEQLADLIRRTAAREYVPDLFRQGASNFQVTRGTTGLSL